MQETPNSHLSPTHTANSAQSKRQHVNWCAYGALS